jgi:hypothetical protein
VELRLLSPVEPEVQAIIDTVIKGIDLLAQGKEWSKKEDAKAAARAAASAARAAGWGASAADCAARAGYCAAASAASAAAKFAVRRRQRDLLLKLIKETPITQKENS